VVADNQANLRLGTKYGKVYVVALTGWSERSEIGGGRKQQTAGTIDVVLPAPTPSGFFDFASASENYPTRTPNHLKQNPTNCYNRSNHTQEFFLNIIINYCVKIISQDLNVYKVALLHQFNWQTKRI